MSHKAKPVSRRAAIAFLVLFLAASVLYISPIIPRPQTNQVHSSMLRKQITRAGNTERTDYVNDAGKITFAADLGYATVVVTAKDHAQLEEFFNEQGEPTRRYSGDYAVLREYDDEGNNIRNTYLDAGGHPAMTTAGYSIEEKKYNQNHLNTEARYYDTEGSPVFSLPYGHGKSNEFDENGRISRTTYIGTDGSPATIRQGYASISYSYYESEGLENGKVENEFYFGPDGSPVRLSLGQYGVHKEYDEYGREAVDTYLDKDGTPTITNKGYTTAVRTFQANNYPATERYYDRYGKPYQLADGHYGIRYVNNQTIYLDENGAEQFNLRAFLYNHSRIVVVLALILVVISSALNRRWNVPVLIVYISIIFYLTLMFRENEGTDANFQLFWSYRKLFTDSKTREEIMRNIWLFVPLGTILYRICPKRRILLVPAALSVTIEAAQYLTGTGLCELDDIISNSLGGFIGYETGRLLRSAACSIIKKGRTNVRSGGQEREEA